MIDTIIVEDMESIKYNLNNINKDMVELHCMLSSSLNEKELKNAQEMINKLNSDFEFLTFEYNSYVNDINERLKRKKDIYSRRSKYCAIVAVIPVIGLFLAVFLVLRNYNRLLEIRVSQDLLNEFSDEISPNIKIISEMLERKNVLINRITNKRNNYYSNKLDLYSFVIELLNDEDYSILNKLNNETKKAIIKILQKDLNTDCNDLLKLLNEEKIKKNNSKKLIKKLEFF